MKGIHILSIVLIFFTCCTTDTNENNSSNSDIAISFKVDSLINKLNMVALEKNVIDYRIEGLKWASSVKDSLYLLELEKQFTEEYIREKFHLAFRQTFTDKEINELYEALIESKVTNQLLFGKSIFYKGSPTEFSGIKAKLDSIENNAVEVEKLKKKSDSFDPINVEAEDGIYATLNYESGIDLQNIQLAKKPAIGTSQFVKIYKDYDIYGNRVITVHLNKSGGEQLLELTKANIEKPIAIVSNHQIISLPIVHEPVDDYKFQISGGFSEKECDAIVKSLIDK